MELSTNRSEPAPERQATPDVSAVMVTYNSAAVVEPALRSLVEHAGERLGEIIVVDNVSTDATRDIVEGFIRTGTPGACPVRLIANSRNVGFGTAANAGARAADPNSRYLSFMNPDILLHSSVFDEMAAVLDRDPAVGLAGPRLEYADEYGAPNPVNNPFWFDGVLARRTRGRLGRVRLGDYRASFMVLGCCTLARRSAFEQVGGFDEEMFLYLEEPATAFRLRRAGYKVVLAWTSTSVGHAMNSSTMPDRSDGATWGKGKIDLYQASERHLVRRYLPAWWPVYRIASASGLYRLWIRSMERNWVGRWEAGADGGGANSGGRSRSPGGRAR